MPDDELTKPLGLPEGRRRSDRCPVVLAIALLAIVAAVGAGRFMATQSRDPASPSTIAHGRKEPGQARRRSSISAGRARA